jgi:hypothetical protein
MGLWREFEAAEASLAQKEAEQAERAAARLAARSQAR